MTTADVSAPQATPLHQRMLRAALLDAEIYEEVEADRSATGQAMTVVMLSAVAAGIGTFENGGWIGINEKYWLVALLPDQSETVNARFIYTNAGGIDKYQVDTLRGALTVAPGGAIEITDRVFVGAKEVSLLDAYAEDYIRTARAKGLPESRVLLDHALRNALLPVLSYLGPAAASIFTGSFVVEKIFAVPGMGTHVVESINNRDQSLILATVLVYAVFLASFNLIVDLLYGLIDPRIRLGARA